MSHGLSNGHVTDDVRWYTSRHPKGAVKQCGTAGYPSERQLGFLSVYLHKWTNDVCPPSTKFLCFPLQL